MGLLLQLRHTSYQLLQRKVDPHKTRLALVAYLVDM